MSGLGERLAVQYCYIIWNLTTCFFNRINDPIDGRLSGCED